MSTNIPPPGPRFPTNIAVITLTVAVILAGVLAALISSLAADGQSTWRAVLFATVVVWVGSCVDSCG